jgi:DNA repair protein RadA/Sms
MARTPSTSVSVAGSLDRRKVGTRAVVATTYLELVAKTAAVQHVCSECGSSSARWLGRCPGCREFGTLVAEVAPARGHRERARVPGLAARPPLRLVDVVAEEAERMTTGVPELDRVLGGGLVPASLVLVGGEPGVGKSTLLLAALGAMSRDRRSLLITGEESVAQVKLRAARLGGCDEIEILAETELEVVCDTLERERPAVCVIDSVQTLWSQEIASGPGSVSQVREAAATLLRVAKQAGVATFLVGHVTKDGTVAGPRVLEHLVDCVLQFEGDRYHAHRILRAVKNRFGSTNEIGIFEMTGAGLVGVPDPSEIFGKTHSGEVGAAVACTLEGTRPLLLEIQALVAPSDLAMPRRVATGVDPKRLAMIVAVLARHAGLPLGGADVFVNVAGGVRIDEPGADLGIALAIASAAKGVPVRDGVAAFGEIGLTGRLRVAAQADRRVAECRKLGLRTVVAPAGTKGAGVEAETLRRALAAGLVETGSENRA